MDTIVQLIQAVHSEATTFAWAALGILLPLCIGMSVVVFIWIRREGLRAGSIHRSVAEQKEISRWHDNAGL
jgi:hypothetical protein